MFVARLHRLSFYLALYALLAGVVGVASAEGEVDDGYDGYGEEVLAGLNAAPRRTTPPRTRAAGGAGYADLITYSRLYSILSDAK
jgi:hypothetical protein